MNFDDEFLNEVERGSDRSSGLDLPNDQVERKWGLIRSIIAIP